jgi:hypothetical protein
MRVRVYSWEYHDDPLRLADEVNACIKSCEDVGSRVLDAQVLVRPGDSAGAPPAYLVVVKYEGGVENMILPDEPAEPAR